MIQVMGRWASNAFRLYLDTPVSVLRAAAEQMAQGAHRDESELRRAVSDLRAGGFNPDGELQTIS